jgi:predicted secreted protein
MSTTTINVNAGSSINLTFNSNPSTGYDWITSTLPSTVHVQKGNFIQGTCEQNETGCGGTVTFTITFSNALTGNSAITINFYYVRSYETTTSLAPTQVYTFKIQ